MQNSRKSTVSRCMMHYILRHWPFREVIRLSLLPLMGCATLA